MLDNFRQNIYTVYCYHIDMKNAFEQFPLKRGHSIPKFQSPRAAIHQTVPSLFFTGVFKTSANEITKHTV
jgi:hypothetical protein